MSTPTPRTDMATYPADCLGTTLVTNRDCSRALERELVALTAERDQLRVEVERLTKSIRVDTPAMLALNEEILKANDEAIARAERAEAEAERYRLVTLRLDAELAAERARLDYLLQWDVTFHDRADIDAELSYGQRKKSTPTLP